MNILDWTFKRATAHPDSLVLRLAYLLAYLVWETTRARSARLARRERMRRHV